MDVMTPSQRRKAMAHNRGRTGPERALASALWCKGLRYLTCDGYEARYGRSLPGHPDMVFPGKRVVVFVDGCFWHGCPECRGVPTESGDFWREKIEANIERDRRVTRALEDDGWRVVRVWEHEVRTRDALSGTTSRVAAKLEEDIDNGPVGSYKNAGQ